MPKRSPRVRRPPQPLGSPEIPATVAERVERSSSTAASFGTWLRSQREHRDVSLREIADETRISMRYLQALEEDRFDILPAPVFARGFLREYARFVGLDADEVVTFYVSASGRSAGGDSAAQEPVVERVATSPWTTVVLLVAAIVGLLVLVGVFSFLAERRDREDTAPPPSVAPVPMTPAVLPPAVATPTSAPEPVAPTAPIEVAVELVERCWVEATVDGVQRISENYGAGESLRLEGKREIVLTLGNPAAARIEVNGAALPVEGRPGRVLRDFRIDLDMVRRLTGVADGDVADATPGGVANP